MNSFDSFILSLINQFARRSFLFDKFVVLLSNNNLLKGAVILAIVWWIWFENEDVRRKREILLATLITCFPALIITQILAKTIFRPRPLNEAALLLRVPYGIEAAQWMQHSSFPSDHAVLFFALALGIFLASRRFGWFAYVYVSLFICLPRIYLGEHYPTDILAGAAIGMAPVWLACLPSVRNRLTGWALRWMSARPSQFYSLTFLVTYLIAELFGPALMIVSFIIRKGHPH
jgi:undecaprenyl-diphosphatase